ncbi:MAG: DUF3575 domain-containing protein [Bacteroidales bacterium]|nr:DUF3575 domain-containing protein [Bacteroidales bacterium]
MTSCLACARRGMELIGICMRGAASPEGPYDNNVMLSRNRARSLATFVTERLGQLNYNINDICTRTQAEDYPYLVLVMRRNQDPDTEEVATIVDQCGGDERLTKKMLQKAQGGRLWTRLLKEYYPNLRAARMVMFFRRARDLEPLALAPKYTPLAFTRDGPSSFILHPLPFGLSRRERPHALSIGTNILYDAFYLPNYGWAPSPNIILEYYPRRGNWTIVGSFTFPYYHRWGKHKFYQIRDYHLEARRYFSPGFHHTGLYLAAYANCNIYGIGFSKRKGWEGEGVGGAVKVGYAVNLGKRWRLDLYAAGGVYWTKFDPYVYGNPITGSEADGLYYYNYTGDVRLFKKRNHHRTWVGPTEVGVTFTWDLLFYRLRKSGASFRRYE